MADRTLTADLIDLQDKINFVSSNTAKIIKYHALSEDLGTRLPELRQDSVGR